MQFQAFFAFSQALNFEFHYNSGLVRPGASFDAFELAFGLFEHHFSSIFDFLGVGGLYQSALWGVYIILVWGAIIENFRVFQYTPPKQLGGVYQNLLQPPAFSF